MKASRTAILEALSLALLIAGFVVYVRYAGVSVELNRSLPANRHCGRQGKDSVLCRNEYKYQNFTMLYYDGLGKKFYDRFMALSKHKSGHLALKIEHEGLSDSVPAFYTYFTGKLPFNYDVDLRGEDLSLIHI